MRWSGRSSRLTLRSGTSPADLLARHGVPANLIAGFRNALAHTYEDILDERVMLTIRDDLPALDAALAGILAG